jgi:putative redox protein
MSDRTGEIRFPGSRGSALAARLDLPLGRPLAYSLFAHCFTCSKDTHAATRISRALTARGIAVLRFDFTGLGGSEGEFGNSNFSSNVEDLVAAAQWLREHYEAPKILIGHSLGGTAVLAAAASVPEALAIATIAAPADPAHVRRLFEPSIQDIEREGEARVVLAGRAFTIKKQFLADLAEHKMQERIAMLRKALLVLHSPRDAIVSIENATAIFVAAKHPKSFVSLDTADHLLAREADAVYVAAVLAAWAGRYIGRQVEEHDATAEPAGTVKVTETRRGKFMQEITVGSHSFIADEPLTYGGSDAGPSPYDLLVAALGACTAMTVRLYADAKRLPLERVTVRLSHDKVHAEDCAECETKDGKIDRIERVIELVGNLEDDQRERLLEIANKCPVHRTLHSEVWIPTRLKS